MSGPFKRLGTLTNYLLPVCLVGAWIQGSGCRQDPLREARKLIEHGKYREAIERLEAVLQEDGGGEPLYLVGRAHAGLGDFHQADAYYRRALAADSTLRVKVIEGYLSLGDQLANTSQEKTAVRAWERILSLDPEYDLAERFYHLADHHFINQNYGRATQLYRQALNSSPLSTLARDGRYRLVVSLETVGRLEEALTWCREPSAGRNQDLIYEEGKIAYLLAEKSLKEGDQVRALQLLRRTTGLGQPRILLDDAYFLIGEIYLEREEYDQALESYKEVLNIDPYRKAGVVQKARERMREIRARKGVGR